MDTLNDKFSSKINKLLSYDWYTPSILDLISIMLKDEKYLKKLLVSLNIKKRTYAKYNYENQIWCTVEEYTVFDVKFNTLQEAEQYKISKLKENTNASKVDGLQELRKIKTIGKEIGKEKFDPKNCNHVEVSIKHNKYITHKYYFTV